MRITMIIAVLLIGVLLILTVCAKPVPAPAPTAPTPATGPAAFVTSDLKVTPLQVDPGTTATFSVIVTNTGGQTGTYKVVLKIDDVIHKTQDVTLAGGASQKVTFNVTAFEKAGPYIFSIDQLSLHLVIEP